MHLEIFLADFAVFRVFWGISRDFAEIPNKFRGSATARIIRSPVQVRVHQQMRCLRVIKKGIKHYLLNNFPSKLKSNSEGEEISIIFKMVRWKQSGKTNQQNQSSLVLDKAMHSSHVKGVHLNVPSSDICHIKWLCDY